MSDDLFTGDNESKAKANISKKTLAASIAGSIAAIALLCGAVYLGFNLINNNTGMNDAEYQEIKKQYEERDIEYAYKDYLSDKQIIESNIANAEHQQKVDEATGETSGNNGSASINLGEMSEAYNKMHDSNTSVLESVGEPLGIKDYTVENVNTAILDQMKKTSDFIKTNYGWPAGDEYPDEYFGEWRAYINDIEAYTINGTEPSTNFYDEFSFDDQAKNLRRSAYDASQYTMVEYQDGQYPNLKKWYSTGRVVFSKIYSTTLTNDNIKLSDEIVSNLQANISTDAGSFKVYLTASVTNDSAGYRVLDLELIS